MMDTVIYKLEASNAASFRLCNLGFDYARLCNLMASHLEDFDGRDASAADTYLLSVARKELKRVIGTRTVNPSAYRKLACRRVLSDFHKFGKDHSYDAEDMTVDLSMKTVTTQVNNITEEPSAVMAIKMFRTLKGDKYRLHVPYVLTDELDISLPSGAIQLVRQDGKFYICVGMKAKPKPKK